MPEYLDDPSVLTKDKLKSELLAHSVELPSGNPTKDVYVQLYLKNLTAQNKKHVPDTTWDAFSSDEELPPPVVSNRSRSSGRKATKKTDKVQPDELDVTTLTDEGLRDELVKIGVDVGPIVASTRKLYEKKLQKLLDGGPAQPPPSQLVITEIQVNHNGHTESDLYSDKEDEVTTAPEPVPEPVPEPEPVPVVERPVRSRGKTPVTTRNRSSQHHTSKSRPEEYSPRPAANPLGNLTRVNQVTLSPVSNVPTFRSQESLLSVSHETEYKPRSISTAGGDIQLHERRQQKINSFLSTCSPVKTHNYTSMLSENVLGRQVEKITASDQNSKVEEKEVLKELFPNDFNSPTGISATCRRPIRGAAGRPLKPGDMWNNENGLFSPKITKTSSSSSSFTESRTVNRVTSLPLVNSSNISSTTRLLPTASPGQTKAEPRGMSLWIKLFLLAIVVAFLFLVYQAMETNGISPFVAPGKEVVSDGTA